MNTHTKDALQSMLSIVSLVDDKGPKGVDGRIVAYVDKDSQISEQYRIMETHISALKSEKNLKIIMITSSAEEDGKTVTSCNLAATIAGYPNKRVALVDMDLRRPSVHTMFNIKREPGVSDILEGRCAAADILKTPAVGNLYLVPAGTEAQHPSDILRSQNTNKFFETLRSSFDYVLIDTPPILAVSDARIIGHLCDAVILVVRFDKTSKNSIKDTLSMLKTAHAAPTACVLVDFRAPTYEYRRYSQYYYKGRRKRDR